jgi:hypothetical protein
MTQNQATRFCPRHACQPWQKSSKIKQHQANSERGFRPSLYMKSSNTIAKKATNQGKSRQVRMRFSPFATQDKDKDKEMDDQDYDKEA